MSFQPNVIRFGEVTVNLTEPRLTRYLQIKLALRVARGQEQHVAELVEANLPALNNSLVLYLSPKSLQVIQAPSGIEDIRRDVRDAFDRVLNPGGAALVEEVLLEEFRIM